MAQENKGSDSDSGCLSQSWGGFSLDSCYDKSAQELVFTALVPDNSWLSIGFGSNMKDTDMIAWFVDNKVGRTGDYWSTEHSSPVLDTVSSLTEGETAVFDSATGMMKFVTRRKLDTGDTEQDFLVTPGEEIPMIYGYKKGTADWIMHDKYGVWSLQIEESGQIEETDIDLKELLRNYEYEAHGWWLWSSWFIFGIALLITKRYAKKHWVVIHYLHAFLGYFVLVVTIVFALKVTHWHPGHGLHHALGTITLFLTILGSISGTVTAGVMKAYNGDKPWSEKEKIERIAWVHRWAGYTMLLVGNVTSASGIGYYFGHIMQEDKRKVLAIVSIVTFVFMVMIFEAIFRVRNKFSYGHVKTPQINSENGKAKAFTLEEIDTKVKNGQSLVIFDNLVLDLDGYERIHPGGKFNLIHNLGRDISKFFFGGYNLVNEPVRRPHHHTQPALDIVKTMIIGVIQGQELVQDEKFKISQKHSVNENTATFTFQSEKGAAIKNLRNWYSDPGMVGRHFLVYSTMACRTKRQYTICSAIRPQLMNQLLSLAKCLLEKNAPKFDYQLLFAKDSNSIDVTLKTYNVPKGLATRIHSKIPSRPESNSVQPEDASQVDLAEADSQVQIAFETHESFFVKGPMGRGLQLKPTGLHVAFCAGTGVLVFLDLVAHLLLQAAQANSVGGKKEDLPEEMRDFFQPGFKLHLYVAFQSRTQSIGLQLIEALEQVNQALGLDNFKATVRLSETDGGPKMPRWTHEYIEQELVPQAGQIQKIWVCGPPALNEMFDKTLGKVADKLKIESHQIDIM